MAAARVHRTRIKGCVESRTHGGARARPARKPGEEMPF